MTVSIIDLATERRIRRLPNRPVALGAEDEAHLLDCLDAIGRALDTDLAGSLVLEEPTARALMRRLLDLRATLADDTGRPALLSRLDTAIAIVETARLPAATAAGTPTERR